jgi:hypothetical protein
VKQAYQHIKNKMVQGLPSADPSASIEGAMPNVVC